MSRDNGIDIDTADALPEMLAELLPYIRTTALKLAGDQTLAEDLIQEASIELWQMDPTRFAASDMEYVRASLYKTMHNVARAERSAVGGARRIGGM
jgi:DNA-directed RNA polymerase specialized sigma24 family protein